MFILIIRSERSITNVLKILLPKYNTVLMCILTSYLTPHASRLLAFPPSSNTLRSLMISLNFLKYYKLKYYTA